MFCIQVADDMTDFEHPATRDAPIQNGSQKPEITPTATSDSALAVVPYDETHLLSFHKEKRELVFGLHSVTIKQNWRNGGVAGVVWDAVSKNF